MRDYRIWLSIAGFLIAGRMLYPVFVGDHSSPVREKELREMVHICRESGETFVLRATTSPEKHPQTGKMTLMPALYCAKCRQWRATAPLDVLHHNPAARLCPKDKTLMTIEGPQPDKK